MHIHDIEYFLKICETGSLNTAARQLFITPQGLSSALSKMEQELGCVLFYRGRTGTFLTPYGHALRPRAELLLQNYYQALAEIDRVRATENGIIRLGYSFGAYSSFVIDYPIRFQEKYPQYKIDYSEMPDGEVEELIEKGGLDIGFAGNPDISRFTAVPVSTSSILFVTHKNSRFFDRESVSIDEIVDEPLNLREDSFATTRLMLEEFRRRDLHPDMLFNTGGIIRSLRFCRTQKANTIILEHLAHDFAYDDLRMIPFREDFKWNLYMITAKDREPSPAVSLFMSYVQNHI